MVDSDLNIAWRNLWRNRRRTILSLSAIAFASALLVFMLAMQFNQYQLLIRSGINTTEGYLQIQAENYQEDRKARYRFAESAVIDSAIREEPRVAAFSKRVELFCLVSSSERALGALVVGVEPDKEPQVSTLKSMIRLGRYLQPGDSDSAIIGALLARNLGISVGDEITILGTGPDGSTGAAIATVTGIFETGIPEADRSFLQMPLDYLQEAFFMTGSVHRIVMKADSLWGLKTVACDLREKIKGESAGKYPLVVLTWRELMPGLLEGIMLDMLIGSVMYLILVLVVAFSILNTFVMAIFERTREFGIMMALGTTPGRLTRLMMSESLFLTTIGIVSGIALGSIVTVYFQEVGLYFGEEAAEMMKQYGLPPRVYPDLNWITATLGPTAVFLITMTAAWLPTLRIRRLKPVEAIYAP